MFCIHSLLGNFIVMSLFKACDWWSTSCGADEEFDKGCIAVANIDNSAEKSDKIIVGSHSGILRIYKPQPVKQEDGSYSSFRPDDLLLETQFKSPILHVGTGILSSTSSLLHLAVLHPFKLSVYSVSAVQGSVEHGTQTKLSLIYEHNLQRHAFSLVIGYFGGIQGKEMLCIQCLDGTLSFFEQERFSFSRFLPKNLIPGPICYVPKTDSFVTVNGFAVESYRFQALASASDENSESENVLFKGKKVTPEWTYTLTDTALDIVMVDDKTSPTIAILGERVLTALNSHGSIKFSKKFSFTPRCFFCFLEEHHGYLIALIVTSNQTLLIYHQTELKWAVQLMFPPVCICRTSFLDIKGILTLLSEKGNLACCYLGTEPSLFVSPLSEPQEIDFKEAEKEMEKLKKIIKTSNQNLLGTQKLGNEISLSLSVSHHLNPPDNEMRDTFGKSFGPTPSIPVKITLKCRSVVHDVRLMVHVEPPLKVSQNVFVFGPIMDGTQGFVTVMLESPYIPSSLKITTHAAYTNSYGAPRIVDASALLPFGVVAKACPPVKDGEAKVTIDINKKSLSVHELFPDVLTDGTSFPGGALGLEYYSGHIVTILPSKTAQRYRVQSDNFPALWLTVSELIRRLQHKYRKEDDNSKLVCNFSSPLPLQEYFKVIDEHFTNRQVIQEVEELIAHRSLQFRVVQKRLLTKLKDSTPSPLNNLDTLLEATHRQIMSVTETMDRHLKALENSCCALSCATNLMLLFVKLSISLKENEWAFLSACFSPTVNFDSHKGWEEKVNVALIYLLKHCLGKGDNETKFPDVQLEPLKDVTKLKKHISLVLDKIMKNTPFTLSDSYYDVSTMNANEADDMNLPEGCKYVDNATPRPDSPSQSTFAEDESNGNLGEPDYHIEETEYSKAFDDLADDEMII